MPALKVLHFGRFYNTNFGGLERYVECLLDGLKGRIMVDNIVANTRFKTEVTHKPGYDIYQIASLGLVASTPICPTMAWWARKLHRLKHYDIVHLHFPDPLSHAVFRSLPGHVKLVISWHSDIVRQRGLLNLYRPFQDNIVRRADAIIAATPLHFSSSTQLGACADPSRLHVVPYGMDYSPYERSPEIQNAIDQIRALHPGKQIVFAIGRHVYYKGFEYLVRAARDLPDGTVVIIGGSGPLTDSLKELAMETGVPDRVFFTGRIPDKSLPAYYHACDVFCLPSVEPSEAFGLVQLEAMACRKPVVCCELNNGVTYVNQHGITGLVVPPRDASALAAALGELLTDSAKRASMGEAGRARVTREFSLDKMVEGTLRVYRQVLSTDSVCTEREPFAEDRQP